jgi:hypothetical protein
MGISVSAGVTVAVGGGGIVGIVGMTVGAVVCVPVLQEATMNTTIIAEIVFTVDMVSSITFQPPMCFKSSVVGSTSFVPC